MSLLSFFYRRLFLLRRSGFPLAAGEDPARVHWVHVHPPCVRVYVHSVLKAGSPLNV